MTNLLLYQVLASTMQEKCEKDTQNDKLWNDKF